MTLTLALPEIPAFEIPDIPDPPLSRLASLFNEKARPLLIKLGRVFCDVAASPATLLSAGNVVLASLTAEPVGIALTAAAAVATIGTKAYESATGRPLGLPYYVLAAVNGLTAASVIYNGIHTQGLHHLLTSFDAEARRTLLSATAFTQWGVGHVIHGLHDAQKTTAKGALDNAQTYYGVGDISAVQGNPCAAGLFALGLAKALRNTGGPPPEVTSPKTFVKKHLTAARLYGVGYFLGSAFSLATGNPAFAGAQALWGTGYLHFEPQLNGQLIDDFKKAAAGKSAATAAASPHPPFSPGPGS